MLFLGVNWINDFNAYVAQTTEHPLAIEVESANGIYLTSSCGKTYMDLISGIGVTNIGHRHPKVIEAIKSQVDKYLHVMVYGEYIQSAQTSLAKRLVENLPDNLDNVYFVNSGTEANEAALKLAKRATGRNQLISFNGSYHGSTHGSLSVTGNEEKKYAVRPLLPDVKFLNFNQSSDLNQITTKTAAVIIETVQGDAGVRVPSIDYMKNLRRQCDETGALLILDEIQTGFGRCGSLFAFEQFQITPDILTMAKGMGGGMPIGAFTASKTLMQCLTANPPLGHITTFGGHPVNCAAALANLNVLLEDNILEKVEEKGAYFESLLNHSAITEIRRIGLMFAIELADFETVSKVVAGCKENGVLSFWFLSCKNSFRIAPPLTITFEEIEKAGKIIQEQLDKL